jgi:hypothetical protein
MTAGVGLCKTADAVEPALFGKRPTEIPRFTVGLSR